LYLDRYFQTIIMSFWIWWLFYQ